uniref:Serine/threonine-protein kinase D1-3-like ubiquitin-like domain-containing protein n=1 Tax=Onchocerca volvulus TaxID=6282 RepID=A0A8R1TYM7_ONCVO
MNKVNISFQSGVFKEVIAVKNGKISLKELRELAAKFIQKIYSKYGFDNILSDYLLLYRHDNNSANILQLITTSNDISDGMLIEIIIGCKFHKIHIEDWRYGINFWALSKLRI